MAEGIVQLQGSCLPAPARIPVLPDIWQNIFYNPEQDPEEPFGRYFFCHHREQTIVKLDRSSHAFAYVFDKKQAAVAAGGDSKPSRTEDYWEIDPEAAVAIKHHVYPRKFLYVPNELT